MDSGKKMSDTTETIKTMMQNDGIDNATLEKVMDKFVVRDKNTVLRTNFQNVSKITALMTIAEDMDKHGLKKSAKTLRFFIARFIENMVSKDGNSWKYIFDAISAIKREKSTSAFDNLLGLKDMEK